MISVRPAEPLPILVVDDDSALIRTLADILRIHGYSPATAGTGTEGLALAERESPALAVIDLRLPDMDGVELAARLHELSELTEVVVLTGNASMESAVAALREHSVDYLLKPVNVEHLLQVASIASERWQRRRAEERLRESDRINGEALEARARQQAAVARLGQRAITADDLIALFNDAVALVAETLELPFSSVYERRSAGDFLLLRAGVGWPAEDIGRTLVSATEETHAGAALVHKEPAIVSDFGLEPRFEGSRERAAQRGIASGMTVVIPGPATPYGVLAAHDVRVRQFTQDDVHFLQAIAHILGTSVERNRTDRAFRQAQRLEAVGRLASGVAHDFNNMLTAITGYGQILQSGLDIGDPRREDVDEILKAAGRAAGLTRQLLAFSRQQVLQPRLVMLNEIVTGMGNMLERLLGANIQVLTAFDADLGLVKADPGQIEQVILNLCVNARDAMPDGGTLTIETGNVELDGGQLRELTIEKAGSYVMLAVTDTGIGMDAETRARIFEPFFTTKPADQGTGLGLATVYGIVKQSGGDVWVYSELGRGTTFKVFLPIHDEPATVQAESQPRRENAPRGSETILFAEDEDAIRKVAKRILERVGYTVLPASNGQEALTLAETHAGKIDLLVTDMMMPQMNGMQLAERLRQKRPGLRALFLSGYTDSTVLEKGPLPAGEHFLQKPFAAETLSTKVREVLDETVGGGRNGHG
jgi:two-component system cell cycle sensor histidine kinase/response regulator CckA